MTLGPVQGVVREWHSEEGWGVFDSPATPGGCWCHFSVLPGPGFREASAGQSVLFAYEVADQDGYAFRATTVE